ncbi:MAG: ABC transporter ATP-binding protein [bacterium]
MSTPVIKVANLGKKYRLGATLNHDTLRDHLACGVKTLWHRLRGNGHFSHADKLALPSSSPAKGGNDEFWALKDVSFEIMQGEIVGIIGRNGAGKSTLLKILSKITEPTKGEVRMRGRVASLLEVGTGFHPELTGRENIYLNGAILGMSRTEIRAKFDEIVAFAEIGQFIDTPVKRYSSGMYVRLAFAVAAHLEPEILLVDEVLAVGDAGFQNKCLGKMGDVAKQGRTVLFVSHNMAAVQNICCKGVILKHGEVHYQGQINETVQKYIETYTIPEKQNLKDITDRVGNGLVRITAITVCDLQGHAVEAVGIGEGCKVYLDYESTRNFTPTCVEIGIAFISILGAKVVMFSNLVAGQLFQSLPSRSKVCCTIPSLPIADGSYFIGASFSSNNEVADWIDKAVRFTVYQSNFYGSGRLYRAGSTHLYLHHTWELA